MIYNQLGTSDLKVSSLGFGAMSLAYNQPKEVDNILQYAFEKGINYIDTADLYDKGMNEVVVGNTIKSFRKDIVLATKVGNKWRPDGTGWDWDVSPLHIQQGLEDSLKRLQTDYIDLYQVHGGTNQDDFDAVVATMENLVQQGKIRYYGISSIRPNVFLRYSDASNIVSNMMQYSILDNRPEEFLYKFGHAGISVIARGVLAQGLLINKEAKPYLQYSKDAVLGVQGQVKDICALYAINEIAVALAYVLKDTTVASALVGVRSTAQLDDILKAYGSLKGIDINFDTLDSNKIQYVDHLV